MKDQTAIVEAFRRTDLSQRKAALATVVRVRGSSYRSPGARMLITDDGKWVGSISGGCLEGDALRKARQVMSDNRPFTVTYDTREESNQNLGISLGCNGVIDVLIEPIDVHDKRNPVSLLERIIEFTAPVALATVFESASHTGEKLLITAAGETMSEFRDPGLNSRVVADLVRVFDTRRSETKEYVVENSNAGVFLELIQPAVSLVIFGGGFDARPVSELAKGLGWHVMVTDECVAHIAPVFFPSADKLSLCDRSFVDRDLTVTPYTACVLMSHNYEYDRDVLKMLLSTDTPYIGILGPRKRFDRMLQELRASGVVLNPGDLHRIHAPMGLDIGAETPDEIAVSIVAEIQGKFANRSGGYLKYRNAPIHHRDAAGDQVFKQVYLSPPGKKSAEQ